MSEYAVIAENDESAWEDIKGEVYHYPKTYKKILMPGCKVIYYKGRMLHAKYADSRLSSEPHYFGIAEIGESVEDPLSSKKDLFCEVRNYQEFSRAVPIKIDASYLESIPTSRKRNYWRFGVREIKKNVYEKIRNLADTEPFKKRAFRLPSLSGEFESTKKEGKKKVRFTTYYERNPLNRKKAIELHGLVCMACAFNFQEKYGNLGRGFIHVHHIRPVSEIGEEAYLDPATDLVVVCANCHAMIHKNKDNTLSVEEITKAISRKV